MVKKKKYDTSQDARRKETIEETLKGLNAATLVNMVKSLWSGFVHIWESAYELRLSQGDAYVYRDVVLEFMARLDRAMVTNLPAGLVETLEGRCGKQ